jgi:hypothetical protein
MARTRNFFGRIRRLGGLLRHAVVVGMLMMALLFLDVLTGCETEDEEPGGVLYGPPPADIDVGGEASADVVVPDLVQDNGMGEMAVLYGPQPVDVVEDTLPDVGPEEEMSVLYGPPPVDVVEDTLPDPEPNEEISVLYGPQPVDVVEDEDVIPEVSDDMPAVYYGPLPVDTTDECMPVALYGPQPCSTDENCQEWYGGENWYCDKEHEINDGCGGTSTWPTCKEK